MTNKLKSPTTLILIFLLNAASLSACSAADDIVRFAGKAGRNADDAARLGRNADDAARLRRNADYAARLRRNADYAARLGKIEQEWVQRVAPSLVEQEINEAIYTHGGLPNNFLSDAQERITQKIIDDANSQGVKLSVTAVSASVSLILRNTVNSLPARATTNEEGRDNNADGEIIRGRRRTNY